MYPVEVGGTLLALRLAAEEDKLAVGGEPGTILAVQLPWCDPMSILWRAEWLDEHSATVVLLLEVGANESEHLPIGRDYRVRGICSQLSFVALRSTANLVSIVSV